MPQELKILISGTLEKNPNLRFDWEQVKTSTFFKEIAADNEAKKMRKNETFKEASNLSIQKKNSY